MQEVVSGEDGWLRVVQRDGRPRVRGFKFMAKVGSFAAVPTARRRFLVRIQVIARRC
jgi:hypothetical protein